MKLEFWVYSQILKKIKQDFQDIKSNSIRSFDESFKKMDINSEEDKNVLRDLVILVLGIRSYRAIYSLLNHFKKCIVSLDLGGSLYHFLYYVITSDDPCLFLVSILSWKKLGVKDLDEGILKMLTNEKQISLVNTYLGNPGKEFESLIEYSAKQSSPDLMKVIIDIHPEGFDIDQCLEFRGLYKTPLMHAASNCSGYDDGYFTARYLLDEGANPNIQNNNGCTALHFAAYAGNVRVIQLLKGRGGNCSIPDKFGKTPRMLAEERGYGSEIIALLNDGNNEFFG